MLDLIQQLDKEEKKADDEAETAFAKWLAARDEQRQPSPEQWKRYEELVNVHKKLLCQRLHLILQWSGTLAYAFCVLHSITMVGVSSCIVFFKPRQSGSFPLQLFL